MTTKFGLKKLLTSCYRMCQNELGAWHSDGQTDRTTLAVARSNVARRALKNKNTVSSKSLILADFEYVILHKISQLLVYVSLLLQFVLGLATFLPRLTGLPVSLLFSRRKFSSSFFFSVSESALRVGYLQMIYEHFTMYQKKGKQMGTEMSCEKSFRYKNAD